MAFSEELADRVRDVIGVREGVTERKMFGGIAWMINGNMACGVMAEDLMVRLDHDDVDQALAEPGVGPMEMTGRRMRGFVVVDGAGVAEPLPLTQWVDAGADFAVSLPAK